MRITQLACYRSKDAISADQKEMDRKLVMVMVVVPWVQTRLVVYMMRCVQDEQEEDVKVSKASRVSRGAKAQTVASDGFIMPSVSVLATF